MNDKTRTKTTSKKSNLSATKDWKLWRAIIVRDLTENGTPNFIGENSKVLNTDLVHFDFGFSLWIDNHL